MGLPAPNSHGPLAEILVTDRDEEDGLPTQIFLSRKKGEIGLIFLEPATGGDVTLPIDATPRELALACQLLGQILALRREIRRDRGSMRQLRRLAHIDPVSELSNRRGWDRELSARFQSPSRSLNSLTLALFDLDDFKQVNDKLGHPVGDKVLLEAGRALMKCVRPEDFCARVGGDEFGLLVTGLEPEQSWRLVERVRSEIGLAASAAAQRPVSISAGFACVPPHQGEAQLLYRQADSALLAAKGSGRSQTCMAEAS